jgi:hypothetical protein
MSTFMVPVDATHWPSLGGQVCDFIETNLVFGPGDLVGLPAVLDDEKRALIYRMYEVYPQSHRMAGRRRFKRCGISLRKGSAKTEFAAWIAACELHPEAPVRCVGWTPGGEPIGGPVTDPYIPMVAYTEEQSEELAYGALRVILEKSALKDDFVIGFERIERKKGTGKAIALAAAPNSVDGARTTFQHFDETHRMTLPRLIAAHRTMLANIPKRQAADAWSLETTTAPEPGTGAVAEATMEYAEAVAAGKVTDARLFFFHRQAGTFRGSDDATDLTTDDGIRAAILEASGPVGVWSDVDSIIEQWHDPRADRAYLERVWLNRLVQGSSQAFDPLRWAALATAEGAAAEGALITIGFDGALFHDATGIVCTDVVAGRQWVAGVWERPLGAKEWQVPTAEVDAVMRGLFERYDVWRLYADPHYWESWIAAWAGAFTEDRVIAWRTNRESAMRDALVLFDTAIKAATLTHSGDARLARHVANARRHDLKKVDENGKPLWLIRKERSDSPHKIDLAMAAVLSWQARTDAIASGETGGPSVWERDDYELVTA